MSEERIIDKICDYLGKNYLLKNSKSMRWISINKIKEELLKYCRLTQNEIQDYFIELCDKLNSCIPCKSQSDVDKMTELLGEMSDFPTNTKPQIYWDREVWIDSGFDDNKCMDILIHTDKLYFKPSDDMIEHPGIRVKYKCMKDERL